MKVLVVADRHGVIDGKHRTFFRSVREGIEYLTDAGLFADYMLGTVTLVPIVAVG